jgi:hypothetical protein
MPTQVTLVATSVEAVGLNQASVTTTPVIVTASGEAVVAASPVTILSSPATSATVSVSPIKTVSVIDDIEAVIAPEDVLVTITKKTTAGELEEFKSQLNEKGYQLSFDKTTYSDNGVLTHVSGTIKSKEGQTGNFSATNFERVVLARVIKNNRTYFRIDIVDKKKYVI